MGTDRGSRRHEQRHDSRDMSRDRRLLDCGWALVYYGDDYDYNYDLIPHLHTCAMPVACANTTKQYY
jgi:hypothetical protein